MLTSVVCEEIIAEARDRLRPTTTTATSCHALKVRRGTIAARALAELGWPFLDAQVVRYGPGGGYDWHVDGPGRATTLLVQLSEPGDYEGGLVEVRGWPEAPTGRGSAAEWPAQFPHRTTEVTAGERWALVSWRP
ncbi:MAG TPA: 2OG-Fe(II) oxygenase [Acidimicrobiales bacterium]|nr:2OG-Fe(II) oxygenase [Acidimicrobiales bacterium]